MTDPGHRRGVVDQHALGKHVRAFSASGHEYTHGEGKVIAYAAHPTVDIECADGSRFSWMAHLCEVIDPPTRTAAWTSEGVDFLRRVMAGEIYTGMSGDGLARWAVGLTDHLRHTPLDKADLARCMNIYWTAPTSLRSKISGQVSEWAEDILTHPVDFTVRRYYRSGDDLSAYWSMTNENGA